MTSKHTEYFKKLKSLINDGVVDECIEGECCFEWVIDDWNKLGKQENSPVFEAGNQKWCVSLYPNGTSDENYVSMFLKNLNIANNPKDNDINISTKFVLSFRNYNEDSSFRAVPVSFIFRNKYPSYGFPKFIKKSDLIMKDDNYFKPIIENGRTVISVYIQVYNTEKMKYINQLKELIKDDPRKVDYIIDENYFEWNVKYWSQLSEEESSPEFNVGDQKWKIILNPNGKGDMKDYSLSLSLKNLDLEKNKNSENSLLCFNYVICIRN
eukprot:jgi/Orpsp1_1/1187205/evm.model.d7180000056099.1